MSQKFKFDWTKVTEEVKNGDKKFEKDKRFWKPTVDEKGNASAVIRFIPMPDGTPWVKLRTHNFNYMENGVKKYWIRNCICTFGFDKNCPICVKNQEYFNSAFEADKKIATARKGKVEFIANILVVKNPANKEDEGKVFLYKFGKKIFEKINNKMNPTKEMLDLGKEQFMPFDLYEGANFMLVQVKQGDYPNFDQSEFASPKPIGSDAQIEKIMENTHDLNEFMSIDKFPTNEEVIQKLGKVLCISQAPVSEMSEQASGPAVPDISDPFCGDDIDDSNYGNPSNPEPEQPAAASDDDDADFFRNLK